MAEKKKSAKKTAGKGAERPRPKRVTRENIMLVLSTRAESTAEVELVKMAPRKPVLVSVYEVLKAHQPGQARVLVRVAASLGYRLGNDTLVRVNHRGYVTVRTTPRYGPGTFLAINENPDGLLLSP